MATIDAIVLAADQAKDLSSDPQITHTALVPVHGKPMLDWVVETLHSSKYIGKVIVVGPDKLDELFSRRYTNKRVVPSLSTLENLTGIAADGTVDQAKGYIVLPCEAILLTSQIIDDACESFLNSDEQISIPLIPPEKFSSESPKPFTVKWENREVVPAVFAFSKTARLVPAAMQKLRQINRERDPLTDAGVILPVVAAIEKTLVERTSTAIGYFRFNYPQAAFSVRYIKDLRYAQQTLPTPWHPRFKKIKLIINPHSGTGLQLPTFLKKLLGIRKRSLDVSSGGNKFTRKIKQYLNEFGMFPEVAETRTAREATETARICSEQGYDLVIAAGGDGTINAVVNGLAGTETALGVVPLGTVNVYAIELGIPMEIRSACQLIAQGNTKRIDLGQADRRYFTCLAGIGFDAFVVKQADQGLKKVLGAAAYLLIGLKNLIVYKFEPIRLSVDDQPVPRSGFIVLIGNGKYYSSNLVISPQASQEDGLLDVVILKSRHIFSFLGYFWGLSRANLIEHENVEYLKGKHIRVFQQGRHHIHIDGEPIGRSPMDFKAVPKALTVVY